MRIPAALAFAMAAADLGTATAAPRDVDPGDGVVLLVPRKSTAQTRRPTRVAARAALSHNWAGAVVTGKGISRVSGTVTVPAVQLPPGDADPSTQYGASIWVGIDGNECQSTILQTGIDVLLKDSTPSFRAWYEWWPGESYDFDGFDIAAGDNITMTVVADTPYAGEVTLINNSRGQTVTQHIDSDTALCQTDAEVSYAALLGGLGSVRLSLGLLLLTVEKPKWIIEDFKADKDGTLIPFVDFGSVNFTDVSPDVTDAEIINLGELWAEPDFFGSTNDDLHPLTDCSIQGHAAISCRYLS